MRQIGPLLRSEARYPLPPPPPPLQLSFYDGGCAPGEGDDFTALLDATSTETMNAASSLGFLILTVFKCDGTVDNNLLHSS